MYDPVRHPDNALRRRNEVLAAMLRHGKHHAARSTRAAVGDPLGLRPGTLYSAQRHPNFFGWASEQLVKRFGERRVEAGGLQVRTTLDPRMQYAARDAVASVLREKTDPAAALVAIDPRTGAVKAMVVVPARRPDDEVQPRVAGGPNGGQRVQAVHARDGDRPGHLGVHRLLRPVAADDHRPEVRVQRRAVDVHNYADESGGYMNLLDATAHSVNTIYAQLVDIVGPRARRQRGAQARHHVAAAAGLLDHARHAGRQSARDDRRVRDARGARRPSRPAGVRGRARPERRR